MKKTVIVLIAVAVVALFYWQFFVPAPAPSVLEEELGNPAGIEETQIPE